MAKVSDVVLTVLQYDWDEFANKHKYNPYVKSAIVKAYLGIDIINVRWDFVKWYTKDMYIDEIMNYFNEHSYLITTLSNDSSIYQEEHVINDEDISDFWDYAPQIKLITDF